VAYAILCVDDKDRYCMEGALDLLNHVYTFLFWEELVKALQEKYGPARFQNQ